MMEQIQDLNSDDEYGEVPEGVDPALWEEMKRWHMRPTTDFLYQIKRGQQGKNIGLATGSKNLDKHIHGIHQARYYLIGADAKIGKTTVADCLFIINAWRDAKLKGKPIKIFYCSFEIGKLDKMSRWVSHWIFILFGKRLSSDYILSREEGKLLTKEDEILVLQAYAKVMEMMKDIVFIEDNVHPTKIFEDLIEAHYEKIGKVFRTELTEEQKKKHKKGYVKGYEPGDPDFLTMLVIDHLALTGSEMGLDTKHIMDKMSKYAVVLRNIFRTTCVFIQQFSPDLMSLMRMPGKKTENSITPQRLDFGDSKATFRDADVILGLVKPINYDFKEYKGYILMSEDAFDSSALGSNFVICFLMGNRYGNADRMLPFFVDYLTGTVYDLPLQPHNVLAMEPWYKKAKELKNDLNK